MTIKDVSRHCHTPWGAKSPLNDSDVEERELGSPVCSPRGRVLACHLKKGKLRAKLRLVLSPASTGPAVWCQPTSKSHRLPTPCTAGPLHRRPPALPAPCTTGPLHRDLLSVSAPHPHEPAHLSAPLPTATSTCDEPSSLSKLCSPSKAQLRCHLLAEAFFGSSPFQSEFISPSLTSVKSASLTTPRPSASLRGAP